MSNIEQKPSAPAEMTPEKKLEIFKDEIGKIKEIEMNKKQAWKKRGMSGEAYDPHFDYINPEYLGQAEREVYEKYKSDSLSEKLFNDLRGSALEKLMKIKADGDDEKYKTISEFWAYLGNRVMEKEGRRYVEEMKHKKNQ